MEVLLLIYSGLLTLFIVMLIHSYENKIKLLNGNLNRLRTASVKNMSDLDQNNVVLQNQVKELKLELVQTRLPEYESKAYINPYNNPMGKE